jgi:hypothetical protein
MKRLGVMIITVTAAIAIAAAQESAPAPAEKKPEVKAPAKVSSKKSSTRTAANKAPAAKAAPALIPAGAKEIEPGLFRWVDSKGQAWRYQKTPFGVMKGPELPEDSKPAPVPTDWIAKDEGDAVTFERPYPFGGKQTWTRKKSELTDLETAVWKRAQDAAKQ